MVALRLVRFAVLLVIPSLVIGSCRERHTDQSEKAPLVSQVLKARELNRQTRMFPGLRQAAQQEFSQADQTLKDAIAAAREGDQRRASQLLDISVRGYRSATLTALESGPIASAKQHIEKAGSSADKEKIRAARNRITAAEKIIADTRNSDFEIVGIVYAVLDKLFAVHAVLDVQGEGGVPCNSPVKAQIFGFEISAPDPGKLLDHAPIYYLEGDSLDISLVLPLCTHVDNIALTLSDGRTIDIDTDAVNYDPIDGISDIQYYYDYIGTRPATEGRYTSLLRLHFPDFDDGRSIGVRISVDSTVAGVDLGDQRSFTVALVKRVGGVQRVGWGETTLKNDFIVDIYDDYGDDGRYQRKDDNGNPVGHPTYNPGYKSLILQVTEAGIRFRWNFTVDISYFCDPSVIIDGVFNVVFEDDSFNVVWDDSGPAVSSSVAFRCELTGLVAEFVKAATERRVQESVRERVGKKVNGLVEVFAGLPIKFLPVETVENEIRVVAQLDVDNVTIDVPYGRRRLRDPVNGGMALNPEDRIIAVGSGLASACGTDGEDRSDCNTLVDPNGLFNSNGELPIPNPWPQNEYGQTGYFKERHKAWNELIRLRRELDRMVFPDEKVGVLIGRFGKAGSVGPYRLMNTFCVVTARSGGEDRVVLGSNDYSYLNTRENGFGSYEVSIAWVPDNLDLPLPSCPSEDLRLKSVLDRPLRSDVN